MKEGYIIGNVEDKKVIKYIRDLVNNYLKSIKSVRKKINLNDFHKYQSISNLNDNRVKYKLYNENDKIRLKYFNLAREHLYTLQVTN